MESNVNDLIIKQKEAVSKVKLVRLKVRLPDICRGLKYTPVSMK
jgi:hypothetical protein